MNEKAENFIVLQLRPSVNNVHNFVIFFLAEIGDLRRIKKKVPFLDVAKRLASGPNTRSSYKNHCNPEE